MRVAAFAGLIALLSCRTAFALHPANAAAVRRIAAFIAAAEQEQAALTPLTEKNGKLDRLKKSLGLLLMSGDENNADFYKRQIAQLEAKIKHLSDARDVARDKAIHLTLTAYGIVPADADGRPEEPAGISYMSPEYGRHISWIPYAEDNDRTRIYQNASGSAFNLWGFGRLNRTSTGHKEFALTGVDGVTTVDRKAFLHGPGFLALILSHEIVHFRQFTTPSRGPKMTSAQRELEAWRKTRGNLAKLAAAGQISGSDNAFAVSQTEGNLKHSSPRWPGSIGRHGSSGGLMKDCRFTTEGRFSRPARVSTT
ncbi:MAG: hypothetical protein KGM24_01325 [Elusimicrobia bacterium]|nr:hypothetical protein [Elusimicrobiota bacterium]